MSFKGPFITYNQPQNSLKKEKILNKEKEEFKISIWISKYIV